jgi:hypothetical protein
MVEAIRIAVTWDVIPCGLADTNVKEKCAAFISSTDEYDQSSQTWVLYNCAHLSFLPHIRVHKKNITSFH